MYILKRCKRKCAFSLAELMIAIAVIGIMSAVFISKINMGIDRARITGMLTDLRGFQMASEMVLREDKPLDETNLNVNLDSALKLENGTSRAKDPWGNNYICSCYTNKPTEVAFNSLGEDEVVSPDDIILRVWRDKEDIRYSIKNLELSGVGKIEG